MTLSRFNTKSRLSIALVTLTTAMWGCADPGGTFDEFVDRYEQKPALSGGACSDTGGPCPIVDSGYTGTYFISLSVKLLRSQPITGTANVVVDGNMVTEMTIQPLLSADRRTPTGNPLPLIAPFAINEDGSFLADYGTIIAPGDANPISGSELETSLQLSGAPGSFCKPGDFLGGDVIGNSIRPLPLDLSTSTFSGQLIADPTDPNSYPEALLNCNKDPADPPKP